MKSPINDFLEALTYAVKEEVVENYFLQRRVVEEELAEVDRLNLKLAARQGEVNRVLAELEELLLEEPYWRTFWDRAGQGDQAPVPGTRTPAGRVWSGSAPGLGWKGRYRGLVKETIRSLNRSLERHQEVLDEARDLVDGVNRDIDRFHANFDFLAIRSMLCQMDPVEVEKKYVLGSDLQGQACLDLDAAMRFKRLSRPSLGPIPNPPPKGALLKAGVEAAALILKQRPGQVRGRMKGRPPGADSDG